VLRKASRVAALAVIAVAVAVIAMAVVVPRLAGATPYAVLSGSMRPAYRPGTLVVVRPVDPAQIRVGDVITYQPRPNDPTVFTHRVVQEKVGVNGFRRFRVRGDANDADDPGWVRPVQIRGRLWYAIPYLGWLSNTMSGVRHHAVLALIAIGLLVYAGAMLAGPRERRPAAEPAPAPFPAATPPARVEPVHVQAVVVDDVPWRSPFCQAPVWDPRHALVRTDGPVVAHAPTGPRSRAAEPALVLPAPRAVVAVPELPVTTVRTSRGGGPWRRVRVRALLGLGIVAVLGTGGTWAYWSDAAPLQGVSLRTGTLSMAVGGATSADVGLSLSNLVPGLSAAAAVTVRNTGTVPFTYTLDSGFGSADADPSQDAVDLLDAVVATVAVGGTPDGDGCSAASGGTYSGTLADGSGSDPLIGPADAVTLRPGQAQTLCVAVALPLAAPISLEGIPAAGDVESTLGAVPALLTFHAQQIVPGGSSSGSAS